MIVLQDAITDVNMSDVISLLLIYQFLTPDNRKEDINIIINIAETTTSQLFINIFQTESDPLVSILSRRFSNVIIEIELAIPSNKIKTLIITQITNKI